MPTTHPPTAVAASSVLTGVQHRYLARAIDIFSVVHMNQHARTLGPYGTAFFDDGADCSFELSPCMNIHCILADLRERLYVENPPMAIVLFLPGLVDTRVASMDCAIYVEVLGQARGTVLGSSMSSLQSAALDHVSEGVALTVAPDGLRLPDNLLERVILANAQRLPAESRIVGQSEVAQVLGDHVCACAQAEASH